MSRGSELAIAAILLIALLPILLLVAMLVWVVDGGPIFFASERMRAPQQPFRLYKFRTMKSGIRGGVTGGDKVQDITRLGMWLRRTRLDELPQIINIIRGDLSFVGPRPPLPEVVRASPQLYQQVLRSKPGVTGLATLMFHAREEQILLRGQTSGEVAELYRLHCVPRKARIDLIYQRRKSTIIDIWLIILTGLHVCGVRNIGRLVRGKNIFRAALRKSNLNAQPQ